MVASPYHRIFSTLLLHITLPTCKKFIFISCHIHEELAITNGSAAKNLQLNHLIACFSYSLVEN